MLGFGPQQGYRKITLQEVTEIVLAAVGEKERADDKDDSWWMIKKHVPDSNEER